MNSKFIYLYIVTILLFSGCTPLGPDFKALDKPTIPKELKRGSSDEKILKRWWRVFGDNSLNKLIEMAYRENLDVKSAGLRIVQARAILGISEGYLYPQQQTLSGSAVSTKNGKNEFASANIGFDVGWEMDFWGKYARGVESSEADLYRAVASYQDILVSILSEVARNYVDYRTAQERITYAKRNIAIQERISRLTEVQFNAGNVSELDMQQALSQLHNTKAILPLIEIEKSRSLNAMALLLATDRESIERIIDRALFFGYGDNINSRKVHSQ